MTSVSSMQICKQSLTHSLRYDWEVEPQFLDYLTDYFLRKWHTATFLALMKDGTIDMAGTKYQIQCIGGKVLACSDEYVLLSFRRPYLFLGIHPVVLVKQTVSPSNKEHSNEA